MTPDDRQPQHPDHTHPNRGYFPEKWLPGGEDWPDWPDEIELDLGWDGPAPADVIGAWEIRFRYIIHSMSLGDNWYIPTQDGEAFSVSPAEGVWYAGVPDGTKLILKRLS